MARVALIHIQDQFLDGDGKLDPLKLDLVGRMGGSWYTRANNASLFEIPKPLRTKGMGVDGLPAGIRNSPVLTGNNLGRLGNLEQLPTADEIDRVAKDDEIRMMQKKLNGNPQKLKKELHWLSQRMLMDEQTKKALALLMYAEKLEA